MRGSDANGEARVVLVFFWCARSGPARRMESSIAYFARRERERLCVVRVDVDENPELVKRFRVSTVPTLVLVRHRRTIARLEGRATVPEIARMLASSLERVPSAA